LNVGVIHGGTLVTRLKPGAKFAARLNGTGWFVAPKRAPCFSMVVVVVETEQYHPPNDL